MKSTKAQQNALMRMNAAIATIRELAPLEVKRENQTRRKRIVRAYESLKCHGPTLNIEIPSVGHWYYAERYLIAIEHVASQLPQEAAS